MTWRTLAIVLVALVKPTIGAPFVVGELVAGRDRVGVAATCVAAGALWYVANCAMYGGEFSVDWFLALEHYPVAIHVGEVGVVVLAELALGAILLSGQPRWR